MDRGFRPVLSRPRFPAVRVLLATLVLAVASVHAQDATPGHTPSVSVPLTLPGTVRPIRPPVFLPGTPPVIIEEGMRRRLMLERREREGPTDDEAARRIAQLSPEERARFKNNLQLWRQLPPEEKQGIRMQADERMRGEMEKAMQESGLRLDGDQRELFMLRYRQERRRLERDLLDQANAERARRMPQIMDRLKHEFGNKGSYSPQGSGPASVPGSGVR